MENTKVMASNNVTSSSLGHEKGMVSFVFWTFWELISIRIIIVRQSYRNFILIYNKEEEIRIFVFSFKIKKKLHIEFDKARQSNMYLSDVTGFSFSISIFSLLLLLWNLDSRPVFSKPIKCTSPIQVWPMLKHLKPSQLLSGQFVSFYSTVCSKPSLLISFVHRQK